MGHSSATRNVLTFPARKTPHYLHSSRMPSLAQQKLLNVMQRYDRMMRDRPTDAAQVLEDVDLLLRHVYDV